MTKFQKIQRILSIVPFWSTFFVVAVTMYELKRCKASKKIWFYFISTFFLAGFVLFVLNEVIMTGKHLLLNVIASGLILAIANVLFVEFQIMCSGTEPTKTKSRRVCGIVICCTTVIIVGIIVFLNTLFSPTVEIEDINGHDNTNLAIISEEDMLNAPDHYAAFSSYALQDGPQTNVIGKMKKYDYQECSFSCKQISGIMTLQATKTMCNNLTLDISSHLESGNMAIAILVDGEYYDSIPINQNCQVELSDISEKTVIVRFAAESAKMDITIKRIEE